MLRIAVVGLVIAVATSCVLKHPPDPTTPEAQRWAKSYGLYVADLSSTAANFQSLDPHLTGNALVASFSTGCRALKAEAQGDMKLPPIPSKTLQIQWVSGLRFMLVAANECIQSLDTTTSASDVVKNDLRTTAYENMAFGQIRLGVVMSFLDIPTNQDPSLTLPGTPIPTTTTVAT